MKVIARFFLGNFYYIFICQKKLYVFGKSIYTEGLLPLIQFNPLKKLSWSTWMPKIFGKTHRIRIYKSGARPFSPGWCSDHPPLLHASSHNFSSSALNFKIYICGVTQLKSTFEKHAALCH